MNHYMYLTGSINSQSIIKIILLCIGLSASQLGLSQGFSEGTHYSIVEKPRSIGASESQGPPTMVEYFSFSCPGCYAIEPSIKALLKDLPSIKLERVHMPFGGQKAKLSQKVFALMELLGAAEHKDAIFNRIHVKRNDFSSDDEIIGYFEELGYEKTKVQQTLGSFSADTLIRKMNKEAVKQKITSVPTLIVNGQYQVNIRALATTGNLSSLVRYLHSLNQEN